MDVLDIEGFNLAQIAKLKWDINAEENSSILEGLEVMFEGTVISADRNMLIPALKDDVVQDIRMGRKKMPKDFKIENQEDFLKFLALHVPLSAYAS